LSLQDTIKLKAKQQRGGEERRGNGKPSKKKGKGWKMIQKNWPFSVAARLAGLRGAPHNGGPQKKKATIGGGDHAGTGAPSRIQG